MQLGEMPMKPGHPNEMSRPAAKPTPISTSWANACGVLRNQRGMTRKALAQHAKVSERYLAQLEGGDGNISIVLLRRIARAHGRAVDAAGA